MENFYPDYLIVKQLLSEKGLATILQLANRAKFQDGGASATDNARQAKKNLQMRAEESIEAQQIQNIVMMAISHNPEIQSAILPKAVLPPLISKYEVGMNYGMHVDSPLMGSQFTIRTDVGMTLFLSEPDTYEGGELLVMTEIGEHKFKLNAGDAVIYPTTRLHQVLEVTKGTRVAVVTWMQSAIRDSQKRGILRQMSHVINSQNDAKSNENKTILQQAHSNLIRMWAEL